MDWRFEMTTCGSCGNGGNCGSDCSKPSGWWDNEFGYNPYGYNQAPVVRPNWWNEQFAPQVIGVGKSTAVDIENCVQNAYSLLQNSAELQAMYDAGYTDDQIKQILREECTKQLGGGEDRLVYQDKMNGTVVAKTWVAAAAIVVPAIATGLIGYFVGKR